jgi:ankyrin repeat protein
VNARDAKGWNALAIASFRHAMNVIPILLLHGGNPTAKNQYGKSALDFADDELDAAKVCVCVYIRTYM